MESSDTPPVETEYKQVSDESIRPDACITCGSEDIRRRSHQFHDMQDLGSPLVKRVLRHEKILWECNACEAQFMLVNPNVPRDTEYTDDVKAYVFKRVLDNGDAANRVAADLGKLHHVTITRQAITLWVKKEREKAEEMLAGGAPVSTHAAPVLSLDGTFKAVRSKKNAATRGSEPVPPSCLHLTRLKDGRLAAFWLLGSERRK